ncbi:hypothetical protein [Agrobacterium tumefaciens]|uniref:hypothetical protein n=1 Tax=Agrobacterium tumefaciens TaxID=358 RepID=UPI0021D21748|nr:hypothetical protein [Agrobacterium tumefaciens]
MTLLPTRAGRLLFVGDCEDGLGRRAQGIRYGNLLGYSKSAHEGSMVDVRKAVSDHACAVPLRNIPVLFDQEFSEFGRTVTHAAALARTLSFAKS